MDKKIATQSESVSKFISFCDNVINMPEPNLSKGYLEGKLKIISELWTKLDITNDAIVQENDDAAQNGYNYFVKKEFEKAFTMYDKATVRILTKLEKYKNPITMPTPTITLPENVVVNANQAKSNIKIKPIDIPIFSGDYKKWISFKNMFESLIHNKTDITNLEKIHYLKSCVTGEAETILAQFDITEEAYAPAYEALKDRFHNEVILIDTHIISILSQPNLTTETSDGIKSLMDVTNENIRALNSLNIDTSTWDPILLLLLVQKLDLSTRRLWEQTLKPKTRPTMKEFLTFLDTRFYALGCQQKFHFSIQSTSNVMQQRNYKRSYSMEHQSNNSSDYKHQFQDKTFPPKIHQSFHNSSTLFQKKCPFRCGGSHHIMDCERFNEADARMKTDLVACAKLCKNCLKGHNGRCSSEPGCQKCGKYHHTLLHFGRETSSLNNRSTLISSRTDSQSQQMSSNIQPEATLQSHHAHLQQIEGQTLVRSSRNLNDCIAWDEPVLLATAIILIRSARDNVFYPFRALLDQASEASYISEHATQFLGLTKRNISASTSGLGGVRTGVIKHVVDFEVRSKRNQSFHINVQAPVVSTVTNPLPSTHLSKIEWDHIKDLQLADPEFHIPAKIDVLLGAPVYGYVLLPGLIKVSPEVPISQNTEFGWILSGGTRTSTSAKHIISSFHLRVELDNQLKKFFEQEEVSQERSLTQEEKECEKFFEDTVQRNGEGRVVVALPFKQEPKLLGSSKGQAISRLMKLETRLASNKNLKMEYSGILEEYESLNHTSLLGDLTQLDDTNAQSLSYYLPHHAVFKPESTTTKTRIVFDASAKTNNGVSLNDLLMVGPTIQQDLMSILMRWRTYEFVLTADITKMYRQIVVRKEDRKFQRFLFRDNTTEPIKVYEHNRVTFGVASATYLSIAA